jgi:hypothetical protein
MVPWHRRNCRIHGSHKLRGAVMRAEYSQLFTLAKLAVFARVMQRDFPVLACFQ